MRLERFVAASLNTAAQSSSGVSDVPPDLRLAQTLIANGEVRVNSEEVRTTGFMVFMGDGVVCDRVEIRGARVPISQSHRMFVLHKPAGVLGVLDRQARMAERAPTNIADLVPDRWWSNDLGMFGRLDKQTTGLCILGRREAAGIGSLLLHPAHHVHKAYRVHLAHNNPLCDGGGDGLRPDAGRVLSEGVALADGTQCEPAVLQVLPGAGPCDCAERLRAFHARRTSPPGDEGCTAYTEVRLTIREGKFHQVKRMLAAVGGHGVHRLHRESFGALSLERMALEVGSVRPMTGEELRAVQTMLPRSRMCPEREHSSRWRGAGRTAHSGLADG